MRCRNCGTEAQAGDRFCSACGERLEDIRHEGNSWDNKTTREHDSWGTRRDETEQYPQGYSHASESGKTMAAITHVLALFTWMLGPLVVYIATDDPFVERNAANAMNWQIMFVVYLVLSTLLVFAFVGIVLLFVLPILDFILIVVATLKASEGEAWQYPLTPQLF